MEGRSERNKLFGIKYARVSYCIVVYGNKTIPRNGRRISFIRYFPKVFRNSNSAIITVILLIALPVETAVGVELLPE